MPMFSSRLGETGMGETIVHKLLTSGSAPTVRPGTAVVKTPEESKAFRRGIYSTPLLLGIGCRYGLAPTSSRWDPARGGRDESSESRDLARS